MDYGELLTGAWRVAWRHKHLWVLGLFASGLGFSGCGSPGQQGYRYETSPGSFGGFVEHHLALIIGLVALAVVVGLVLAVISVAATGGLVSGTDTAYRGETLRGRDAWRRGWASFWRLLGLWLLVGVVVTVVVLLLVSIVLNWALRALVLDGARIVDSLRRGTALLRTRPGTSFGVWAINLGLGLVVGMVVGGAVLAAAVPAILISVAAWRAEAAILWAFLPLAALVMLAVLGLLKAINSTFFSAYWTIARQLTAAPASSAARPDED